MDRMYTPGEGKCTPWGRRSVALDPRPFNLDLNLVPPGLRRNVPKYLALWPQITEMDCHVPARAEVPFNASMRPTFWRGIRYVSAAPRSPSMAQEVASDGGS
jgi:hypothetical protein